MTARDVSYNTSSLLPISAVEGECSAEVQRKEGEKVNQMPAEASSPSLLPKVRCSNKLILLSGSAHPTPLLLLNQLSDALGAFVGALGSQALSHGLPTRATR